MAWEWDAPRATEPFLSSRLDQTSVVCRGLTITMGDEAKSSGPKRSFGDGPNEVAMKLVPQTSMLVIWEAHH